MSTSKKIRVTQYVVTGNELITEFISTLKQLPEADVQKLRSVEHLISSCLELRELTGLDSLKKDLVTYFQYLLCDFLRNSSIGIKNQLKHLMFTGPPGHGKTTVAKIVAKIYASIGLLPCKNKCRSANAEKNSSDHSLSTEINNKQIKLLQNAVVASTKFIELYENSYNCLIAKLTQECSTKLPNFDGNSLNKDINSIIAYIREMIQNNSHVTPSRHRRILSTLRRKSHRIKESFGNYLASTVKKINNIQQLLDSGLITLQENVKELNQSSIETVLINKNDSDKSSSQEFKPIFVEATRADLVSKYLGGTPHRTNELLDKAGGGVLYIDEFYSLLTGERDSYGKEAVNHIIHEMTDPDSDIIFIVSGYENKINEMNEIQPGLERRFRSFNFEKYSLEELYQMLILKLKEQNYNIEFKNQEQIKKLKQYLRNEKLLRNGPASIEFILVDIKMYTAAKYFTKILLEEKTLPTTIPGHDVIEVVKKLVDKCKEDMDISLLHFYGRI